MGGGGGVDTREGEMPEWRQVGETLKRKEASTLPRLKVIFPSAFPW